MNIQHPRVDVEETDRELIYSFDLPGVNKDNIHVEEHNGMLTVSGERKMR